MRFRVAALVLAAGVGVLLPAAPTTPAAATVGSVQVIDVPHGFRIGPRGATVIGVTETQGVVLSRELDPPANSHQGNYEKVLIGPDGTETVLDASLIGVYGDHLLFRQNGGYLAQLLPDGPVEDVPLPAGSVFVAADQDGLLLNAGDVFSLQLQLLPWSGGEPVAVPGIPDGRIVTGVWPSAHGVVLEVPVSNGTTVDRYAYVDTATPQAWTFQAEAGVVSVNDGTIAWTSGYPDSVIKTMQVPAPGSDVLPPVVERPEPDLAGVTDKKRGVTLLPVGDDVIVSPEYGGEVIGVDPDGNTVSHLPWGHDVTGQGSEFVALGGESDEVQSLVRIDPAAASITHLADIPPVPGVADSVSIDGDRVVVTDDTAGTSSLVERSVDFEAAAVGPPVVLGPNIGTGPCPSVPVDVNVCRRQAASGGITMWQDKYGWQASTGGQSALWSEFKVTSSTRIDGHWALDGDWLLDRNTQTTTRVGTGGDLQAGVLYLPASKVPGVPVNNVIARDLSTGQASSFPIPECTKVGAVRVAGSWLLVTCWNSSVQRFVYDMATGTSVLADGSGVLRLGNGFLVRRVGDDLSWTPLAGAPDWQPIGTAATYWEALATSTGPEPTMAWVDSSGQAHAALLPVSTSAVPAPPTGPTLAGAPALTMNVIDYPDATASVEVGWLPAPAAAQVTKYEVWLNKGPYLYNSRLFLDPDVTSHVFGPLSAGEAWEINVRAWNIAGPSPIATVHPVPLGPPPAPTNVHATLDASTSTMKVTWDWAASDLTEPVTGFSLWTGTDRVVVGPGARSHTWAVTTPWPSTVSVVAEGAQLSSWTQSSPAIHLPTVKLTGVPRVQLGTSVRLTLAGADDAGLKGLDVRWRQAALGHRLGAWRVRWIGRQPGALAVKNLRPGSTYCFSARAVDSVGNRSTWTTARCVAVAADDRILMREGRWTTVRADRYFNGSAVRSTSRDTLLTTSPAAYADAVWLVATTCPTCGSVIVQSRSGYVRPVSLRSTSRHDRVLIRIPWGYHSNGPIRIATYGKRGPVTIDGIAVLSY